MTARPRARGLSIPFPGKPGPHNAITDVSGVLVGFSTLIEDRPDVQVRTGVTAILPRGHEPEPGIVWAGIHAFNGNGEMTGSHWIEDGGYFVGPVCITNTHSVGIVHHAVVRWMIDRYLADRSVEHMWEMPVVAETYDGMLNDINGQHVTEAHALAAINGAAGGPVAEGSVGGGTGMVCYGFKGGTGTSSRTVEIEGHGFTVGALVQANHGIRPWFSVLGVPVGQLMPENDASYGAERGSIIVVLATDLPAMPHQLRRLARRATIGIARGGTVGGNGSGDIFLAFSTANTRRVPQRSPAALEMDYINDEYLDIVYQAAVEATEEAVVNALLAAEDCPTFRPPGGVCRALDHGGLVKALKHYGRM